MKVFLWLPWNEPWKNKKVGRMREKWTIVTKIKGGCLCRQNLNRLFASAVGKPDGQWFNIIIQRIIIILVGVFIHNLFLGRQKYEKFSKVNTIFAILALCIMQSNTTKTLFGWNYAFVHFGLDQFSLNQLKFSYWLDSGGVIHSTPSDIEMIRDSILGWLVATLVYCSINFSYLS
jgi:hypothetical protein